MKPTRPLDRPYSLREAAVQFHLEAVGVRECSRNSASEEGSATDGGNRTQLFPEPVFTCPADVGSAFCRTSYTVVRSTACWMLIVSSSQKAQPCVSQASEIGKNRYYSVPHIRIRSTEYSVVSHPLSPFLLFGSCANRPDGTASMHLRCTLSAPRVGSYTACSQPSPS